MQLWGDGCTLAAIVVIAMVLLRQVLIREGPVTHWRIQGAIAVYLLFGMGYSHAYHLAELFNPGSFSSSIGPMSNISDWAYYSFVTLTTVGYGDITAVRPVARSLSIGEALTGQLYLAVLVARLVAMEVVSWQQQSRDS